MNYFQWNPRTVFWASPASFLAHFRRFGRHFGRLMMAPGCLTYYWAHLKSVTWDWTDLSVRDEGFYSDGVALHFGRQGARSAAGEGGDS
jgi:hypothetical protein